MKITVILCTYNRGYSLVNALKSVAAQNVHHSIAWEVLVVDNNSLDQTREIVEMFRHQHPGRFRYLFEPQQGKSHALNAGIQAAKGDILAFMDDDVIVDPMWLQNLTATLVDGDWAGSGGRILPAQAFTPPRWLAIDGPYSLGATLYAHFDLGDKPRQIELAPYGANMAFRREMFTRYGGFRTDLGPRPGSEIRGEDEEFASRLMTAGERLRYEPSAVVFHAILQDRIRKEFFLKWWFDNGHASMLRVGKRPDILGIPRYFFSIPKGVARTLLAALKWMLELHPQRRFFLKTRVWYLTGQIVGIYRQLRPKVP